MGVRSFASKIDMPAISAVMQPTVSDWYDDAQIELVKPDIEGSNYTRTTNAKDRTPVVLWTGKARIQAVRWPNVATAKQAAVALREVIFHLPVLEDNPVPPYLQQGWRVNVLSSPLAPRFESGLFVITTSVNSSYDWDYRIETTMDQGASL